MSQYFVLFRNGPLLRAARISISSLDNDLVCKGVRFRHDGGLTHWSHLVDSERLLVGFSLDSLEAANRTEEWRAWWDKVENRELTDFHEAYVFLKQPMPKAWNTDCAFFVGGEVYSGEGGEFLIAIPDSSIEYALKGGGSWNEVGFELENEALVEDSVRGSK